MVTAPELMAELADVLGRTKMRRFITEEDGDALLEAVSRFAEMLPPLGDVPPYTRDPKDDMFVACALLGGARYLVSVDQDLLVLESVDTVTIVTPEEFLRRTG